MRDIFLLCAGYCLLMLLFAQMGGSLFAGLFTSDSHTLTLTSHALSIYTLVLPAVAVQYTIVDGLSAMGLLKFALPFSLFRKLVFLSAVLLLPRLWGVDALFYTQPVSDFIGAGFTLFGFFVLLARYTRRHTDFLSPLS